MREAFYIDITFSFLLHTLRDYETFGIYVTQSFFKHIFGLKIIVSLHESCSIFHRYEFFIVIT